MERIGLALILGGGVIMAAQKALEMVRQAQARVLRTPYGNPAPKVVHRVLPPKDTQFRRIVIVGDVHGCPDELQALLDKVGFHSGVDLLLSVGDLVNKGPDSEKVLKMAREHGVIAVRGNHDDAAYEAFRAWLDGRDMPKPAKHHWVPGLEADLAEMLQEMPLTLQLPAYGVILVHAGLVPGVPLEQQRWFDLEKMRDVVPAAEESLADQAADSLAGGADPDGLPTGDFDWEAAEEQLAALAAAQRAELAKAASSGGTGGSSAAGGGGQGEVAGSFAAIGPQAGEQPASGPAPASGASLLPPGLQLRAREQPNPLGRAWASVWPPAGPLHVFFGHDAKRRLQRYPAATGLDTGCVYGGELTAAVLPPLDEAGRPLLQRLNLPPGAEEFSLANGLPAFLVSVPAKEVHSDKYTKKEAQVKGERQEQAKQHTREALAHSHLHPHSPELPPLPGQGQQQQQAGAAVGTAGAAAAGAAAGAGRVMEAELASLAGPSAAKGAEEKKRE